MEPGTCGQTLQDCRTAHISLEAHSFLHLGVSITGGTPIVGWFIMENPNLTWMMTRGTPPFQETSISKPMNFIYIIHQHPDKTNHFPIFAASKAPKNPRPSFQLTTGGGGENLNICGLTANFPFLFGWFSPYPLVN